MNILTSQPPETVDIGGRSVPIASGFREGIRFEMMALDENLTLPYRVPAERVCDRLPRVLEVYSVYVVPQNPFSASHSCLSCCRSDVGVLAKRSLDAYANYEQLVGGVETLFKSSSGVVMDYANNAYAPAQRGLLQ